jgi:hypothetical protein
MRNNAMAKRSITPVRSPAQAIDQPSSATEKIAVSLRGLWKTYPGGTNPAVRDLILSTFTMARF